MGFVSIELESLGEEQSGEVYTDKNIREISEASEDLNVTPTQYLPYYIGRILTDPEPDRQEKVVGLFRREVEIGQSLGSELIELPASPMPGVKLEWKTVYAGGPPSSVHVESSFSWSEAWEEYVHVIGKCADVVQGAGLRLAVEPMPRYIVSNSDAMLRLLCDVGSQTLGVNLDTGHLFVQKEIVPIAIEKLEERIFATHLSDNDGKTEYHWAPGKGDLDWEAILKALRKVNYQGVLNIEVSGVEDLDKEFLEGKEHVESILKSSGIDI